jgi:hypothetical protein
MLKMEYGIEASIYRTTVGATDLTTGDKNLTRVRYGLDRVIWMPIKFETLAFYSASFLKAAREFAYGGYQDQEFKKVIIDGRDLPDGFEILPEDFLVQNHRKYEIKLAEKLEVDSGYQLIVQRLVGAPVNEIHETVNYQAVRFLQKLSEVLVHSQTKTPTTSINVSTGNEAWGNPGNVLVSNDGYATVNLDSGISDELRVTFNFSVPANATILGIEARIERNAITTGGDVRDLTIRLRKTAGLVGNNKASASNWPLGTDAIATYGSSSDLWGTTWTPEEINSPDFGISIEAQGFDNPMTGRIDQVVLKVYYQ